MFALHPSLGFFHECYRRQELIVWPVATVGCCDGSHARAQESRRTACGVPALRSGEGLGALETSGEEAAEDASLDVLTDLIGSCQGLASLSIQGTPANAARPLDDSRWRRAQRARIRARSVGAAILAGTAPKVSDLDVFGWDTHTDQGFIQGRVANALEELDSAMRALHDASGPRWADTAIFISTEFGRSVEVNADGGTGHGLASAAFLMGGAVKGGRIHGSWLGIAGLEDPKAVGSMVNVRSIAGQIEQDMLGRSGALLRAVE
jgi:uncharacterized protein (DUF1501 family)